MDSDHTLALQQQVARLQALLEASRRIHATIDLNGVLRAALQIVVLELEMQGAFFTDFPFSEGSIPAALLLSPKQNESTRGVSRFPLLDKSGEKITELVVVSQNGCQLTLEETDFLESLAVQTSVAIENARHHERVLHLQRVDFDLASARAIQSSFLPQSLNKIPNYRLALRLMPCWEVAGDYVDVLPLPTGEQIMIVADVAGKGMASALIGSSFRSAFRAMALAQLPLTQIATQLNALHHSEGLEARTRYVTSLFLRLDPADHTLEVVNAGHNPAVLWPGRKTEHVLLHASGPPIGLIDAASYTLETHKLNAGARLLAYTDGLTEVFRDDDEFGLDRLMEACWTCRGRDCDVILDHIWKAINAFAATPEQRDDMSALILLRE